MKNLLLTQLGMLVGALIMYTLDFPLNSLIANHLILTLGYLTCFVQVKAWRNEELKKL
jgi:hypothetical protein